MVNSTNSAFTNYALRIKHYELKLSTLHDRVNLLGGE